MFELFARVDFLGCYKFLVKKTKKKHVNTKNDDAANSVLISPAALYNNNTDKKI